MQINTEITKTQCEQVTKNNISCFKCCRWRSLATERRQTTSDWNLLRTKAYCAPSPYEPSILLLSFKLRMHYLPILRVANSSSCSASTPSQRSECAGLKLCCIVAVESGQLVVLLVDILPASEEFVPLWDFRLLLSVITVVVAVAVAVAVAICSVALLCRSTLQLIT